MAINIEAIIWYLFLIDSVGANIFVWGSPKFTKWYKRKYKKLLKYLPLTKAWCFVYLILVLWVGNALCRLGVLWW